MVRDLARISRAGSSFIKRSRRKLKWPENGKLLIKPRAIDGHKPVAVILEK